MSMGPDSLDGQGAEILETGGKALRDVSSSQFRSFVVRSLSGYFPLD